jgi:hypothetical protein
VAKARHVLIGAVALAFAGLGDADRGPKAEGALAVGSTGDVVTFGIAFGMAVDQPKGKAQEAALDFCRAFKGASRAANARCEIKATFSGQCYAVAIDPQAGTPGAGWGIGEDQIVANDKAMTMCEQTAGARKAFCQIAGAGCDVKD